MAGTLPRVTALIPVFDGERFVERAIASALEQDYPSELLDVVVVDDGSSDGTPAILERVAASSAGRVQILTQRNSGNPAAVARAAAVARGDLLALLDADDAWEPTKTRRQAELLAERAHVGLVYGDMRVIDADERVIQESWLDGEIPPEGRCAARLLAGNVATASSVMFRANLRDALFPVPADVAYTDWWLAVRVAEVAEVAYLAEPRTLYRFHGKNQTLGTTGGARRRELCKTLAFQRRFLRTIGPESGSAREIAAAWEAFETFTRDAIGLSASPFEMPVDVSDADRAVARAEAVVAAAQLERGELDAALIGFVRAAAADPWLEQARDGVMAALAASPGGACVPGQTPLAQARPFVVLAFADELIDDPALAGDYAQRMAGADHVTLAIDASDGDPVLAVERLAPVLVEAELVGNDAIDVLALVGPLDAVGRARLVAGTHAVYSRSAERGPAGPHFGPGELGELRRLSGGARI